MPEAALRAGLARALLCRLASQSWAQEKKMAWRQQVGTGSLRLALASTIALGWGGCGLEKLADDAVAVVKVLVDNPQADREIVEFAADIVVGVAWSVVRGGACLA